MTNNNRYCPSETECENQSYPLNEVTVKIKQDEDNFILGTVLFSHYSNEECEFFRAQFRAVAEINISHLYVNKINNKYKSYPDSIEVLVNKINKRVKFGPKGVIMVNPNSLGIGSYLFSKVIEWTKKNYLDYSVWSGSLAVVDKLQGKENNRRTNFYKNLGFDVNFFTEDEGEGEFKAKTVSQLKTNFKIDKVNEVSIENIVTLIDNSCEKIKNTQAENRIYNSEIEWLNIKLKKYKRRELFFLTVILVSMTILLFSL